jgi:hypothetical protein
MEDAVGYVFDPIKNDAIAAFVNCVKFVRTGLQGPMTAEGGRVSPDDVIAGGYPPYEGQTVRQLLEALRTEIDQFLA